MEVKVTLRNPLDHNDQIDYWIIPNDSPLSNDWVNSLKEVLKKGNLLEKNYCFMGFAKSPRTIEYLCQELNNAVYQINNFVWSTPYVIEEYFVPDTVRFGEEYEATWGGDDKTKLGLSIKHGVMNRLHNHFEQLQGTVDNLSPYYREADHQTKYAIRQLNIICHEIESLILSQRKLVMAPEWQRPSQITTFLNCERHELTDNHRQDFLTNGYDRQFGYVYMHWAQIGKTLFEVFRDEHAPELTDSVCDEITHLKYYSGEFDIEWGRDIVRNSNAPWHCQEQLAFENWLLKHGLDPKDPTLSLGYLALGKVDLERSFGTEDEFAIWDILSTHLDIYKITVDDVEQTYNYCWSDDNFKKQQIDMMRPGYDFSSRG